MVTRSSRARARLGRAHLPGATEAERVAARQALTEARYLDALDAAARASDPPLTDEQRDRVIEYLRHSDVL